ncbi:MAG: ADP-ribosylglycohydrolase family protein [Promethearchaeota archaeon]
MKLDYLDKFSGTLLGVAIGDTLGQPFEGWLREKIQSKVKNFKEFVMKNKKLFNTYTDDTQLTIHTARALIEGSGFNIDNFVRAYVNWLDDPPIGPGYGCLISIKKLKYGVSWKEAASNSGGNGTAMRISPIGLFYNNEPEELKKVAYQSSLMTHSHPAAAASAIVVARAISYLIGKNPEDGFSVDEFFNTMIDSIADSQEPIWNEFISILKRVKENIGIPINSGLIKFSQIGVKSPFFIEEYLGKAFVHPYAISTVACAIFIFINKLNSFEDCIYELAGAGGDSDTVGAIGGSLAGAYFGMENIPIELIDLLKNKKLILNISEDLYLKFMERNYMR